MTKKELLENKVFQAAPDDMEIVFMPNIGQFCHIFKDDVSFERGQFVMSGCVVETTIMIIDTTNRDFRLMKNGQMFRRLED